MYVVFPLSSCMGSGRVSNFFFASVTDSGKYIASVFDLFCVFPACIWRPNLVR